MTIPVSRPIHPRIAAVPGPWLRAAVIVGLVLLAYNYSLMTLARGLTLQTPLGYLALVPLLALGLAVARLRMGPTELPIHDRQVDWIVGLSLLAIAGAVLILLPVSTSSTFWLERIDLLTLPVFVAGLITLLFGVRRAWALRFPLAFLLLAWPVPFTLGLAATGGTFTDITAGIVGAFTRIVPIAHPSPGDATLFYMGSGPHAFGVGIGSACSGVNSFVGFLLLGAAMLYLVRGPLPRRAAWLAVGLVLTVGLNVLRIIGILAVGASFGEAAAMDVLHPVAGLIVFTIAVAGMVTLVPRFGLRFLAPPAATPGSADPPAAGPPAAPAQGPAASPVRRVRPAIVVAGVVALALAATNAAYSRYESISSGLADARLHSFDVRTAQVPAWHTQFVAKFAQVVQFFGPTATWQRVSYQPTKSAAITSSRTVYVDVVTTDNPGSFAAYGIEACYTFHGYTIASISTVDIGAGVSGQVIDYHNPKNDTDWSALWWEWPYTENGATRYERIVVFMADGPKAHFTGVLDVAVPTQTPAFATTDKFLVTLGRTIVRSQLKGSAG